MARGLSVFKVQSSSLKDSNSGEDLEEYLRCMQDNGRIPFPQLREGVFTNENSITGNYFEVREWCFGKRLMKILVKGAPKIEVLRLEMRFSDLRADDIPSERDLMEIFSANFDHLKEVYLAYIPTLSSLEFTAHILQRAPKIDKITIKDYNYFFIHHNP